MRFFFVRLFVFCFLFCIWTYRLSLKNVVYIGLRSVDPMERHIAEQHDMLIYGMEDVDRCGIVQVMETALAKVDPDGKRGIHISFDIDALDGLEAPSTGTPGIKQLANTIEYSRH